MAKGAKAVVGFEANGGTLTGTPCTVGGKVLAALPTRDSFLPALAVLALAAKNAQPLSAVASSFRLPFAAADRLENFPVETSAALMAHAALRPGGACRLPGADRRAGTHQRHRRAAGDARGRAESFTSAPPGTPRKCAATSKRPAKKLRSAFWRRDLTLSEPGPAGRNDAIVGAVAKTSDSLLTATAAPLTSASVAQMAELVDAPASGAGTRKGVEVRVLFWAPFPFEYCIKINVSKTLISQAVQEAVRWQGHCGACVEVRLRAE